MKMILVCAHLYRVFLISPIFIKVAELDQLDETRVEHNGYSDSVIGKGP